jgi:DNA end-binding protein Ku
MAQTGKVAIARVVIRSKEQLVALRPMGDALGMATMIFADEVLPPESIEEIGEVSEVKTTKRELDIAEQLVQSLAGDFEPEKYTDSYREQVLDMVERKAQGEVIAVQPEPEDLTAPAPDLMGALKASLEAVRERDGQGGAKPKPAKRKAAAKKTPAKAPKSAGKKGSGTSSKRSSSKAAAKS